MHLSDVFEIVIQIQPQIELLTNNNQAINIDEILKKATKDFGTFKIGEKEYIYFKKGGYLILDPLLCVKKELEECEKRALFDGLTGCITKIETEHILEKMLKNYLRYKKEPFSLIAFDIDHFKHINDTFGHLVGDSVLKELAHLVQNSLREADICGRIGGEEFLIILPNTKTAGALRLAKRIRQTVEEHEFIYQNKKISITISLGVTSVSITDSLESLLSRVDEALYDAKYKGRNRVEYR